MARWSQPNTVGRCVTVIIIVLAACLSLQLLPGAQAKADGDDCLRIAFPEGSKDSIQFEMYRGVMRDTGLCVEPVRMPNARAILSMRSGDIDGVFAFLDEFEDKVGVPIVRGTVQVGNPDGMLVVREGTITAIEDLTTEAIGVWLGVSWSEDLLKDYAHTVQCVGGPSMMVDMLAHGRIDGMLINGFSLGMVGGVPDGYTAISIRDLIVHSWLTAEHAALLPQFDKGTEEFLRTVAALRQRAPCNQPDPAACP